MKDKIRNKGFWVSLISAVLVFVQSLGLKIDVPAVNEIFGALLTVLVVLGIVSNPASGSGYFDGGAGQSDSDKDKADKEDCRTEGAGESEKAGALTAGGESGADAAENQEKPDGAVKGRL